MSLYEFNQVAGAESRIRRLERGERYLRGGEQVTASSYLRSVPENVLTPNGLQIDLTLGGVRAAGGVLPTINNSDFVVVANDTFVTIYADGTHGSKQIIQRRSDGTVNVIPPLSITITGLVASTTYNLLPFWSPNNSCTIGCVEGDSGFPKIAITGTPTQFQLQQQFSGGREPLSDGPLTFKTVAAAAPSATGGIGSDGDPLTAPPRCVILGTDIETVDGSDYETKHYPWTEWWHIESESGRSLYCTPDHPLYTWDGRKIEAKDVALNELLCCRDGDERITMSGPHRRVCTKVQVSMPKLHLFWANGFLSHNMKAG